MATFGHRRRGHRLRHPFIDSLEPLEQEEEPLPIPGLSAHEELGVIRVLDAAINRACEGLRVVEDYVRFILDDQFLTEQLKALRHDLVAALAMIADDQRLAAEGFVTGLQEELIDLVTRREVLMIRAQGRMADKKFQEAEKLIEELRSLEGREDFSLYIAEQQKKVFSSDKLIQARIDALFNKTQMLVNQYLDPAPINHLATQLQEAQTSGKF